MADENREASQQLEQRYTVRQVTHVQVSWTERGRGEGGKWTLQLILDNGVKEYILEPDEDDADLLVKLFAQGTHTTFDEERKVLMFGNVAVK